MIFEIILFTLIDIMYQQKYRISWPTYSDHLKSMMKELMMNDDLSDVTLVTEDKKHIKANINILSACSPVFKFALKTHKTSSPIMYLRGIQYSEILSILEFIYLGEATFYEERMDEFIAVAKSLEIKELCNVTTETNDKLKDEKSNSVTSTEKEQEQGVPSNHMPKEAKQEVKIEEDVGVNNKVKCDQCHKTYANKYSMLVHKKAAHTGVKFACDQCDYQATTQGTLTLHIRSKHEGISYPCDKCEYQATIPKDLKRHTQAKHDGVKYLCDKCDYTTAWEKEISTHRRKNCPSIL